MTNTIYASFKYVTLAEKAAGALMDRGVLADHISLVRSADDHIVGEGSPRTTGVIVGGPGTNQTMGTGMQPGTGAHANTPDSTSYTSSAFAPGDEAAYRNPGDAPSVPPVVAAGSGVAPIGIATPEYEAGYDPTMESTPHDPEQKAKEGITTTTSADAGAGAISGAGIGVGVGVLAALASIFVPGVGLVIGGGALATALGGLAATAGAGAVSGAVVGYLKDQGLDEQAALDMDKVRSEGGAILSVQYPSADVSEIEIREVLEKYGATSLGAVGANRSGYVA